MPSGDHGDARYKSHPKQFIQESLYRWSNRTIPTILNIVSMPILVHITIMTTAGNSHCKIGNTILENRRAIGVLKWYLH